MNDLETLKNLVLAPYILLASALSKVPRKVGGNQFRHCFCTLGILLNYKLFKDSILLKASLLHDLLEDLDLPETQLDEIRDTDQDANRVAKLVWEVTRRKEETKTQYLQRLLHNGSRKAMLLKCADRISNLTDLNRDTFTDQKIASYLDQTERFVIPMAEKVNSKMAGELMELVAKRREML
jgi:GTP pyrophosphokinase